MFIFLLASLKNSHYICNINNKWHSASNGHITLLLNLFIYFLNAQSAVYNGYIYVHAVSDILCSSLKGGAFNIWNIFNLENVYNKKEEKSYL
jgi:hypothetical protein